MSELVSFDTQNGTGDEPACVEWLAQQLGQFNPDKLINQKVSRKHGKPDSAYVLAVWGEPKLVLNVHIDTVPSGQGWLSDPLILRREEDRVIGLGACDIKGAAACILSALARVKPNNVAVLFSGDEEQGSEIMPEVIKAGHLSGVEAAIICEPTGCKVGKQHRGMLALKSAFSGPGGHSSLADHIEAPLLKASRLADALGKYGEANLNFGTPPYQGLCMNVGGILSDGAYNVIPTSATLQFSLRPPPGDNVQIRETDLHSIAKSLGAESETLVAFEPFATEDMAGFKTLFESYDFVDLPYWTEAAMVSGAGINAVVFGPGHIEQAHQPEEWVSYAQLDAATRLYEAALAKGLAK